MDIKDSLKAGFLRSNFKDRLKSRLHKAILTTALLVAIIGGSAKAQQDAQLSKDTLVNDVFDKVSVLMDAVKAYAKAGEKAKALRNIDILIKTGTELHDETIIQAALAEKNKIQQASFTANARLIYVNGKNYYEVKVMTDDKDVGEAKAMELMDEWFKKRGTNPKTQIHIEKTSDNKFKIIAISEL